ncbi:hypothetical protein Bbelb_082600 [Branchiostoma belcheri]|nr:hypothetical protein Bbelb_082600 [Branchiostoma belcheri]
MATGSAAVNHGEFPTCTLVASLEVTEHKRVCMGAAHNVNSDTRVRMGEVSVADVLLHPDLHTLAGYVDSVEEAMQLNEEVEEMEEINDLLAWAILQDQERFDNSPSSDTIVSEGEAKLASTMDRSCAYDASAQAQADTDEASKFRHHFQKGGYEDTLLDAAITRAQERSREDTLQKKKPTTPQDRRVLAGNNMQSISPASSNHYQEILEPTRKTGYWLGCDVDYGQGYKCKEFADDLAPIVTHLFNASYEEGTVPIDWKSANVVPVPKFAGASKAQDMRPVSLLSVLAKLLERSILKRLLPSIQAVIKDQYAYVKGSSTTLALVRMVQTWLTAVDSNKPTLVRAIFADMSKAFDRVDHARLLQRVIDIHTSPRMQRWIVSYLQNRRQRVVIDGETSSWRTLTSGVPQGGVLSPYLFILFMSTRTTVHIDTMNVGYADDVTLSRTLSVALADQDKTVEDESSHLNSWAEDNKMTLNGGKSLLLQICFSRSVPIPPTITLGGQPVPSVDCAKGLGFLIDKDLTFNEQVNSMISNASRRLHYLRLLTKQGTSVTDLIQIYLALVRPVLEYGHVLLVGCSKEQELAIERVQRRALRIISLGGRRSVPDLPTLKSRREDAAVHLFQRMLQEDHPLHDLVPPSRSGATGRTLRNSSTISVPRARTERLRNSFLHCAIRLYNKTISTE